MRGSLFITTGINGRKEFPLREGRYTIGRSDQAAIQIVSEQISRLHAEIIVEKNQVRILDRGSANGTAINGRFITNGSIKHGDKILLGDVTVEYEHPWGGSNASKTIKPTPTDPKSKLYLAATKVIADKIRPRALWPMFTLLFSLAFLSISISASFSYQKIMTDRLNAAAMSKAHELVRYMAEKNRENLSLKNELLLDVDSVTKENGVRQAFIVDGRGRILAPLSHRNHLDSDPFIAEALSQNTNQKILPSPRLEDGSHTFVHPIRDYNEQTGSYQTLGVAKINFSPKDAIGPLPEVSRLMTLLILAAIGLALALGWVASKALSLPITQLAERVHQWRTGQNFEKEAVPFKDWTALYEAIDLAMEESHEA